MPLLTTQVKPYVSIAILPLLDSTLYLEGAEKGVVATIGKLPFGNPYYPVIFKKPNIQLKSVNANVGGKPENEIAYHIHDFFSGYNGTMLVGRLLGATSTTKILEVKKDDSGNLYIDSSTDINIFGDNNIKDWEDTAPTEAVEVVINSCIQTKHSIEIENVNDYITLSIYDEFGNQIFSVSGGASYDSVDDNGIPNYIGNLADNKIVTIKVDTSNENYESNFNLVATFENGLVTESGDDNLDMAISVLQSKAELCDYAITAGNTDITTIQRFRNEVTYPAKLPLLIDIHANTLQQAVDWKTALGMPYKDCYYIWNRGKDDFSFLGLGKQNIGLSGWIVGQIVRRNLTGMIDDVENRVSEAIAGVDYPIPRIKADELETLSDDELKTLVDNRINTIRKFIKSTGTEVIAIGDCLSGNPKEQSTKLFNVVEGYLFIERYIARIMQQKLFKNLEEARAWIDVEVGKLFEKCDLLNYFNKDEEERYKYVVEKIQPDTIKVSFQYVPEGIMRRGVIQGEVTQKINTN